MKIKKDDLVIMTAGKDRGRKGKILKVFSKDKKVVVEGLNIVKKHVRPKRQGEKGQVIQAPRLVDISNVKLICTKCKKPTRVGYKIVDSGGKKKNKKYRICKKCKKEI
jgi:large subunit ribosomal protein L24